MLRVKLFWCQFLLKDWFGLVFIHKIYITKITSWVHVQVLYVQYLSSPVLYPFKYWVELSNSFERHPSLKWFKHKIVQVLSANFGVATVKQSLPFTNIFLNFWRDRVPLWGRRNCFWTTKNHTIITSHFYNPSLICPSNPIKHCKNVRHRNPNLTILLPITVDIRITVELASLD